MGSNKVPITDYDKAKAPWYFVWYKFLEIVGLWFFTFGFYYIGYYVLETYPSLQRWLIEINNITIPIGVFDYWTVGFIIVFLVVLLYYILVGWTTANWVAAKKKTETSKGSKRRKLLQKSEDRKKFGFCVGDEAEYTCKSDSAANGERLGQKCIVGKISSSGRKIHPLWKNGEKGGVESDFVLASSFKFKKKPLPKLK